MEDRTMAFRQRNRRPHLAPERIHEGAEVENIYKRYFLSIGLACETVPHGTPEWRAAFQIKFGRPAYRRAAWLQVRDALREMVPAWVYEAMDDHFSRGTALHFTQGFSNDAKRKMLAAVS
jgi:hypothetical protein